jgi:hypothetical protein
MNPNEALCCVYNNLRCSYIVNAEFRHLTSGYDLAHGAANEYQ